jgi:hypothetical protein
MMEQEQLTRLAQHRQRMAEAGLGALQTARFDKSRNDAIQREIESYWADMRDYYEREHDG